MFFTGASLRISRKRERAVNRSPRRDRSRREYSDISQPQSQSLPDGQVAYSCGDDYFETLERVRWDVFAAACYSAQENRSSRRQETAIGLRQSLRLQGTTHHGVGVPSLGLQRPGELLDYALSYLVRS
jgi:hypothetical protein